MSKRLAARDHIPARCVPKREPCHLTFYFQSSCSRTKRRWSRILSANIIGSNGFVITATEQRAFNIPTSLARALAVMKTNGIFAVFGFSRRRASIAGPLMFGMTTSQRMRSGARLVATAMASLASPQLVSSIAGLRASENATMSRIIGSSSM